MRRSISTLTVSAIFILSAFAFLPSFVMGATEYLDPDGDNGTNNFTPTGCTTHSDCIDDAIREPNTGIDGNYLTSSNQNVIDDHTYSNPGVSGTVSDVEVWIYGRTGDSGDNFGATPSGVSGWTPSQVETGAPGTSNSWVSAAWTGLSIAVSNFNSLVVALESEQAGGPGGTWVIETAYVELTYTAGAAASLTVTLRKSDNQQERIAVGRWGNVTYDAGSTEQNSTNFIRAQCDDCDGTDDSFWVNWSGTTWTSSDTGDTVTIDGNVVFFYYETTSGTADPDDGGWSWSDSNVDADGIYQITFENSGTTYVWVRYRIESVPSPLSGCTDLDQAYTVELDR